MKKLNFGCGKNDIREGWYNVDIQKHPKIDKSFDFNKFPYPFKDNTFSYIYSDNVFEHLDNPKKVLFELYRISKNNGIIEIIVPYYRSMAAFGFDHKHFFTSTTFHTLLHPEKHDHFKEVQKKIEIIEQNLIPSKLGKLIPSKKLRWLASLVFGEIICFVHIKLKVVK